MIATRNDRSERQAAARAFEEAQHRALTDERLHVFAPCTCGIDGLLFWMDREDDVVHYWVEWWTTQPGTRLPLLQRVRTAWRILRHGTAATHELVLSSRGAERLAQWLQHDPVTAEPVSSIPVISDLLARRDTSWDDAEALFGVDTLIDAVVARSVHDAGFYAGAAFARRQYLTNRNIVRGGGQGGTETIAAALDTVDVLERAGDAQSAAAIRDVARLATGYWEDLEDFGRLKDTLADAMGITFKCPIDVLQRAIDHFKARNNAE